MLLRVEKMRNVFLLLLLKDRITPTTTMRTRATTDFSLLPPSEIKRMEYDLKQQWQTEHIEDLEEKVDEILFWCREVDGKLSNKKDK